MANEMVQFGAMQEMAKAVAASKLWKSAANPEQALGLMLLCQSEGLHPMTAVRRYDLIQGTPTLKSEAQLAEFYKRGGCVKWITRDENTCEAKFSHPKNCPDGVIIKWTMDMAKKAGLANKDNWRNYPRQMLSARVQAEGVQVVDPGAGLGMLTNEEAIDVQNVIADSAADYSAALTGEPLQELESLPEITLDEKAFKKLRGELNQALLPITEMQAFRETCAGFQAKYTRAIWPRETLWDKTYEGKPETFWLLAESHKKRLETESFARSPEGQHRWRDELAKVTTELLFRTFENTYATNPHYTTQDNQDAIRAKAIELGIPEYIEDNEIHEAIP